MLILGLVDIPWWILLILTISLYLIYSSRDFDYFEKQGIPYLKPWPFFGTSLGLFRKGQAMYHMDIMEQHEGNAVVGDFAFGPPSVVVFSGDFLSRIMVKEHNSFMNRFTVRSGSVINDNMVTSLRDEHWKHARNEMTPSFTSGKLKKMNKEINRCAQALVTSMTKSLKESDGVISSRRYTGPFTMDVISSTAFGIRVNSQENPNDPFVMNAKKAFDIQLVRPDILLMLVFPKVAQLMIYLGYTFEFFGREQVNFFTKVTKQTMDMRKDDKTNTHEDFLQLMMRAQRGENIHDKDEDHEHEGDSPSPATKPASDSPATKQPLKGLTTDEILANAMIFFVAGYDTTATSLQFFLHNMARFPDEQQRLYDEIHKVIGDEDEVDYQKLSDMPFLDQCVMENLRMYPPLVSIDRVANHDVTVDNVRFRKDMVAQIPIFAIHHDPKKWSDPWTFNPDRFSPENKKLHHAYHFIPFGQGPRNCIGMRLALLEIKVAIIYMLRAFKITACDKTLSHFTWQPKALLVPNEDVVVKIEPRVLSEE